MALPTPQSQRFLATQFNFTYNTKIAYRNQLTTSTAIRSRIPCRCSAIAINFPSSLADVAGISWGSTSVQGRREVMEDDLVIRSDGLDGFSFAAVIDGHGGLSFVKYLRNGDYIQIIVIISFLWRLLLLAGFEKGPYNDVISRYQRPVTDIIEITV
ncbi:Thylakoid-associated phosphatase 38 isoform 3 [Hibiscus syriacus]|uniref:Thylakoid-associated phosphatase 38 isoform 3 n=1 Tax=Hibiscus syriacus TaxID=106335 RepID=A0A6A3B048_HIBSY|nr:Thylakoid-associated phosphatase 38 isoform 3 [Hibiscus syriacus]